MMRMGLLLLLIALKWLFVVEVSAQVEHYYLPARCSPWETESLISTKAVDPRLIPAEKHHQGQTPSCSFHAAMVGIEAIYNLDRGVLDSHAAPQSLSTLDAMLENGECTARSSSTLPLAADPIKFTHQMRMAGEAGLSVGETVDLAEQVNSCILYQSTKCLDEQCGNSSHSSCFAQVCQNPAVMEFNSLFGNVKKIESAMSRLDPMPVVDLLKGSFVKVKLPPFDIRTWDNFDSKEDLKMQILDQFNQENPLPLTLSTCRYGEDNGPCGSENILHAISMIGVKIKTCTHPKTKAKREIFVGVFKNSYGNIREEYNLDRIIDGMYKHQPTFSAVIPCGKGGLSKCHTPPFVFDRHSDPLFTFIQVNDLIGFRADMPKVNTNKLNAYGLTHLIHATMYNRLPFIEALLEDKRTNLNEVDKIGKTALFHAADYGNLEIVRMLVKHGAEVDTPNEGVTPLAQAVSQGNIDVVKLLLKSGASIKSVTKAGMSLLDIANNPKNPAHKAEILMILQAHQNSL